MNKTTSRMYDIREDGYQLRFLNAFRPPPFPSVFEIKLPSRPQHHQEKPQFL